MYKDRVLFIMTFPHSDKMGRQNCYKNLRQAIFLIAHAVTSVTVAPISVYHGQNISVPPVLIHASFVEASLGSNWIAVITASETNMAMTTGAGRPFFQKTASPSPPTSAPLVNPRKENAAFSTKSTWRLR